MALESSLEQPDGREDARPRRDEDAPDAELAGDPGGVDRAAAAERDEREVARVAAALNGRTDLIARIMLALASSWQP